MQFYDIFVSGRALGDPHIKTGDGLDYTMNGLGEFILMKVSGRNPNTFFSIIEMQGLFRDATFQEISRIPEMKLKPLKLWI